MKQWWQLFYGQIACFVAAGLLFGIVVREHGFAASSVPGLGLSLILAVVGWIGPQIVHELAEINDQLAGRSKDLHKFLRDLRANNKHGE